jgi:hypothetical protein
MTKFSFVHSYTHSPKLVKDFIFSDDFNAFHDEIVKKFELNDEQELNFTYLLQDLTVKFLEPVAVSELTNLISGRNIVKEELISNLSYLVFTRFKPLVDKLWREAEAKEKTAKASREQAFKDIIAGMKTGTPSKNIVHLGKISQKPSIEFKSQTLNPKIINQNVKIPNIVAPKTKPVNLQPEILNPKIVQIPSVPQPQIPPTSQKSDYHPSDDRLRGGSLQSQAQTTSQKPPFQYPDTTSGLPRIDQIETNTAGMQKINIETEPSSGLTQPIPKTELTSAPNTKPAIKDNDTEQKIENFQEKKPATQPETPLTNPSETQPKQEKEVLDLSGI